MEHHIGNFIIDDEQLSPLEKALRDGTFEQYVKNSGEDLSQDIPNDFLEVQDFDEAMEEIKKEIDSLPCIDGVFLSPEEEERIEQILNF